MIGGRSLLTLELGFLLFLMEGIYASPNAREGSFVSSEGRHCSIQYLRGGHTEGLSGLGGLSLGHAHVWDRLVGLVWVGLPGSRVLGGAAGDGARGFLPEGSWVGALEALPAGGLVGPLIPFPAGAQSSPFPCGKCT